MINKKQKLVIFHPALPPYRIDVFNLFHEQFDAKFYFSNGNLLSQKFDQNILQKRIKFQFNLLKRGFNVRGRAFRLDVFSVLKKENPEIVLCSEYNVVMVTVYLYKIIKKSQFKIITISDDNLDIAIKCRGIRRVLRNYLVKKIDGVTVTNQEVAKWYEEYLKPKAKIIIFPVIQDEMAFRASLIKTLRISEQYIMDFNLIDKKVFLYTGRLVKVKNLNTLVMAFVKSSSKEDVLIIVGNGSEELRLQKLVQENNARNVIFVGRLEGDRLLAWYNIAQVFVLPSTFEPFGAVVNEALMSGCYALCSKLAGASSLIEENVNGNIFDPYNELQLGRLIHSASFRIKTVNSQIQLKPDLMPYKFKDKIDLLMNDLLVLVISGLS